MSGFGIEMEMEMKMEMKMERAPFTSEILICIFQALRDFIFDKKSRK